jgi:hypothetical protein
MGYRRVVGSLSAALIVASVGQAAPAHANEMTENALGTYSFAFGDHAAQLKWVLGPCDGDAPNCVTVRQFGIKDTTMKSAPWTGYAFWNVGAWTTTVEVPNVIVCPDQSKHTAPATFAWDAATGKGFRTYTDPGICTEKTQQVSVPFTLIKLDSVVPTPAASPAPAAAPKPATAVPAPAAPGAAESPAA